MPETVSRNNRKGRARRAVPRVAEPRSTRSLAVAMVLPLTLLVTALVFSASFSNQLLNFDDPENISQNEAIRSVDSHHLATYFTRPLEGMYTPLVYLSYAIDYQIGGLDVRAYHADNLLLHLLNVILVWLIVRSLTGSMAVSALVPALFALHPANVAAVVPLSLRSSLLYAFFYLASYLAYLSYLRTGNRRRFALSCALFVLSVLSKSAAVVFPLLLLLTDYHYRRGWTRDVVIEKLPFLVVSLVFGLVAIAVRNDIAMMSGLLHYSMLERLCVAAYDLVSYARTLIAPVALSAFYRYPARTAGHLAPAVYLAPVVLLAAAWLVYRLRARRLLVFGALFFLIHIVLVLKVVPLGVEFAADRYLYLASIGLFVVAADACRPAFSAIPRTGLACVAVVAVLFSVASYARCGDWKDSETFYTRILERDPDNGFAHNNLGRVLAVKGRTADAAWHYAEAVRLEPEYSLPHLNLAEALATEDRTADAIREFTEALRLDPSDAKAHGGLGLALAQQGRMAEAIEHLRESARLDPAVAHIHTNLGAALATQGRTDDAITEYRAALALDPTAAEAHNDLGAALASRGRLDEAVQQFAEAVRINPDFADARRNLGLACVRMNRDDDALGQFLEALRVDPRLEDVHYNAAVLFARKGQTADAIQHLESALKLAPNDDAARRLLEELARSRAK